MVDKASETSTSLATAASDTAKALATDIYKDTVKPSATEIGRTAGIVVRTCLEPINIIFSNMHRCISMLGSAVEKKLSKSNTGTLVSPPPNIAAPVALHYSLLGDGKDTEDLRDMFENLLLSSMDTDTSSTVHPAFASIISQMTNDEARVVKSISALRYEYIQDQNRSMFYTILGSDIGIHEDKIEMCVSNLVRLGLIEMHTGFAGHIASAPPALLSMFRRRHPNASLDTDGVYLLLMTVSHLGVSFINTCVRGRSPFKENLR